MAHPGHLLRSFRSHQMKTKCCSFSLQPQPCFSYVPPLLFHRLPETSPTSTPATQQHSLALAHAPFQWNARPLITFQHSANKPPLPSPWNLPSLPQWDTNSQSFQFQNIGSPVHLKAFVGVSQSHCHPHPHGWFLFILQVLTLRSPLRGHSYGFSPPPPPTTTLFPSWFLSQLVKMSLFVHCYLLVTSTRFWSPVRTNTFTALLP